MTSGNILILEADRHLRRAWGRALSSGGNHVASFASVEKAARAARRQPYELLVVGAQEPQLLNMLLARFPPDMGALIIATEDTIGRAAECSGAGIHSFLIEPFSTKRLKDSVAQAIDRTRLVKEDLRSKTLACLERASRLLASQAEIEPFFRLVAEVSAAVTKANYISLITRDETTGNLVVRAEKGNYQPAWQKICQQTIKIAKLTMLDETTPSSRLSRLTADAGITAILCLPLVIKGEVAGAINHIKVTEGARFTSSDINFASILGWWCSIILENSRLFYSLQNQHLHTEKLLQEICLAQENERKRISIEIHDGVAQWLVGASYDIKACSALISQSRFTDLELEFAKVRQKLQRSVRELRRAIANLRPLPLEEKGLLGVLKQAAETLNEEGIRCYTEINGPLPELTLAQENTTYWIIQEALTNIRNHSRATEVSLRLHCGNGTVSVEVSDNGQGFEPNQVMPSSIQLGHMGLLGMQERAELLDGYLTISSQPGKGTSVGFSFPVSSRVAVKTELV